MSDQSITPCECQPTAFPFACPRHGCRKTAHWHNLCRTRSDYFELWEQSRGPGQSLPDAAGGGYGTAPGIAAQAWNLATSIAAFIADGCHTVDEAEHARRLAVCDVCDQRRDNVCLACGCILALKARGRAMQCPLGKWAALEAASCRSPRAPAFESFNPQASTAVFNPEPPPATGPPEVNQPSPPPESTGHTT